MDLLTYAVNRKLTQSEDPLLEYVARGKDVPVDVLEGSFRELLRPLEDEQSALLVEDYLKMLEKYVPIQYTGNQPDGSYKVTGEISENLLEAIRLVHGKNQEEVISEMVAEGTKQITNRSVSVGTVSLTELTAQMESLTDNMAEIQGFPEEEFGDEELLEEVVDGIEEEVPEHQEELDDLIEEVVPETTEPVEEEVVEPEEVFEEEDVFEEEVEPEEESFEDEQVDEVEAEEILEDMSEEEVEALESEMLVEGIKRVYTRLVEDLKAFGLDESLGLSL